MMVRMLLMMMVKENHAIKYVAVHVYMKRNKMMTEFKEEDLLFRCFNQR